MPLYLRKDETDSYFGSPKRDFTAKLSSFFLRVCLKTSSLGLHLAVSRRPHSSMPLLKGFLAALCSLFIAPSGRHLHTFSTGSVITSFQFTKPPLPFFSSSSAIPLSLLSSPISLSPRAVRLPCAPSRGVKMIPLRNKAKKSTSIAMTTPALELLQASRINLFNRNAAAPN